MKKFLVVFLSVLLVLSLAACGQKTEPAPADNGGETAEALYTPGTYKGTGSGFGGTLEVEVTVSENAIEDIKIVSDSETAGRAETDDAKEFVIDDIITNGTTEVDSVAGATMTSDAIKDAVAMALAVASGEATGTATETEEPAGLFTAGTYEETVSGRNGKMTVEVVLGDNTIDAVNVKDHQETATVASVALERIPSKIVELQTTNIDAVTGATVTSNAIIYAVKQAVKEAGGDQAVLDAIDGKAKPQATIEKTADVIVVGGGGAGMASALAAADGGASVILIEKTSMLGGNTVVCGGAMNAADTEWAAQFDPVAGEDTTLEQYAAVDVATLPEEYQADFLTLKAQIEEYLAGDRSKHFDSVELHKFQTMYHGLRQDLKGETVYGNYDLVSVLTEKAMDAIAWLGEKGIKWDNSKVTQPTGAMWRRGHNTSMIKGTEYVVALEPVIAAAGEIMYETAGKELIIEDGRVVGVKAEQADGTEVILHANKAVILACGGFGNNIEMCQEYNTYWAEIPDDMKTTNASGQTGDGITMGLQAGAALTGMNFIQLMHVSDPVSGDLFTGLIPQQSANYIMFNQAGKRFVAETAPRDTIAQAAIDNGGLFFLIADSEIAEEARWLSDWEVEVENGRAYKADTLEELGKLMGYDDATIATFVEEVEKFNGYVDAANDPDFNRTAFDQKIDNGPFFATPRKPAIHHTMGGLVIDTDAHVLNENGEIIPGLYAAGEVTGGIHGGNRLGGNAVADVMVFGRIAGTNAAAEEAQEAAPAGAATETTGGLQIGQVITAAHGNKCFSQVTAVVQGDVIVAAYIDEYQFAAADQVMGVPNSDAADGFAAGYAEGQVLLSKRMETEYYSANMKEKAGSTVAIDKNYDAIQAFAVGKTIAELEAYKGDDKAVDAVSEATLADTGNYLAAIAEAAKVAQGTEAVAYDGDTSALKLNVLIGAAHGNKCFSTAAALTDGKTIVLSWLDEFQFAAADQVMGVPNSDAADGFAAGYAEGQVLLSKRMETEYYSAMMAEKAGSTVAINKNYDAIQAAVNGLSIDEAKVLAGQENVLDAVSGATLADTANYILLIVEAASN